MNGYLSYNRSRVSNRTVFLCEQTEFAVVVAAVSLNYLLGASALSYAFPPHIPTPFVAFEEMCTSHKGMSSR